MIQKVMVDELFFRRVACGKYGKISVICVLLTARQAITSKVSKVAQLICDRHVSLFQERCHLNIQNKFKIIMVYKDEIYTIILHQKEQ